mmetsp:Transcript_28307/g.78882  ORF Transcript_28307/g.78882 Transcript_28307/m.78882 type:complete len:118 (+) Transcript_28307:1198-1551(+)
MDTPGGAGARAEARLSSVQAGLGAAEGSASSGAELTGISAVSSACSADGLIKNEAGARRGVRRGAAVGTGNILPRTPASPALGGSLAIVPEGTVKCYGDTTVPAAARTAVAPVVDDG